MKLKKSKKANLENKRVVFFQVGLIVTLSIVLMAFEWTTIQNNSLDMNLYDRGEEVEEWAEVTIHKKKLPEMPKPKIIQTIEIVDDKTDIDEEIDISSEVTDETTNDLEIIFEDEPDIVDEETPIFTVVEKMPEFPGGLSTMYKYMSDNIDYPDGAKEVGIQGPVHISFVVSSDGSIRDVQLLRGIGGGCDEEAMRVIESMPNWIPGYQLTKKVDVRMTLPVVFKLSN